MIIPAAEHLLIFEVFAPLVVFLGFSMAWLAGWEPGERAVTRASAGLFGVSLAVTILLAVSMGVNGWQPVTADLQAWFHGERYSFPLTLVADGLSLPLLALTTFLSGLIGSFSRRYLHRDPGFFRFFLLLFLFAFGSGLAFAAGSLDLLIVGWELVGLTSVLLIAFFGERREPVLNALWTFSVYKLTDLGLLLGVFVLHHVAGSASCKLLFQGDWPAQTTGLSLPTASLAGILLLIAACGKSAQIPFSGWLPRAMEGPTPSSAIFYGAISVHLGVYLLLRVGPIVLASPFVSWAVVLVGLMTAIHGTTSGRAAPDAKTSLAYAALGQLGLIFVEIGLGFETLALVHAIGHAALRTLQFLRAPSMLHDYHRLHAASGGQLAKTGVHYEILSPAIQLRLYRFALERGYLDGVIDRFVAGPCVRLARILSGNSGERSVPASRVRSVEARQPGLIGEMDA